MIFCYSLFFFHNESITSKHSGKERSVAPKKFFMTLFILTLQIKIINSNQKNVFFFILMFRSISIKNIIFGLCSPWKNAKLVMKIICVHMRSWLDALSSLSKSRPAVHIWVLVPYCLYSRLKFSELLIYCLLFIVASSTSCWMLVKDQLRSWGKILLNHCS